MANEGKTLANNVDAILGKLFEIEGRQLTLRESALVEKNIDLGGSVDGFMFRGKRYGRNGFVRTRGIYSPLDPSLVPEMHRLADDHKTVATDKDQIRWALITVLRGVTSFQDMRDALPNCVKDLIPELANLDRTRPEAYTLADNPDSYNQYMKRREKIEFYVAARLLY